MPSGTAKRRLAFVAAGLGLCTVSGLAELWGGQSVMQVLILGLLGQAVTAAALCFERERRALAWAVLGFGAAALFTSAVAFVSAGWLLGNVESCTDFCGVATIFLMGAFGAVGVTAVLLGGSGVVASLNRAVRTRVLAIVAVAVVTVSGALLAAYTASPDAELRAAARGFQPPPGFTSTTGGAEVGGNWACWSGQCTVAFGMYSGPPMETALAKRVATGHMLRRLDLGQLQVTGGGRDQWNCRPLDEETMPTRDIRYCTAVFSDGHLYYLVGLEVPPGAEATSLSVTVTSDPLDWLPV